MINSKAMKGLFKPKKQENKFNFKDYLINHGITEKKFLKIHIEHECSKSIDESCINIECHYNFLNMHEDELYVEVMQEIQAERKAVEERTKKALQKYYGTSVGD